MALRAPLDPLHMIWYYADLADVDYSGDPAYSLAKLARYGVVVTGEPGGISGAAAQVLEHLLHSTAVYGYVQGSAWPGEPVPPGDNLAAIARCAQAGYRGVYVDIFGGAPEAQQNGWLDAAHQAGLQVVVNASDPAAVLAGGGLHLQPGDWFLLESFYARSDGYYAGDEPGGTFAGTLQTYLAGVSAAHQAGLRVAGLAYPLGYQAALARGAPDEAASWLLAVAVGLDGWAYGTAEPSVPWPGSESFRLPVGNRLVTPLQRTANAGHYQAVTDAGTIWFTEQAGARQAGFAGRPGRNAGWWLAGAGVAGAGGLAWLLSARRRGRTGSRPRR